MTAALWLACSAWIAQTPTAPATGASDAAAYCQYIQSSADAAAAPLLWPQLLASAAVSNAFEVANDTPLQLRGRIIAGVEVSTSNILRGLALQEQALADCQRYRASSSLRALIERHRDGQSRAALAAKLAVLQEGLPAAEHTLETRRGALGHSQTTLAALRDAELRLDGLRANLAQTQQDLQSVSPALQLGRSIDSLLEARRSADAAVEGQDARLRQLSSWDISLRGGYDRIIDTQETWPVFATLVFRASLGLPAQVSSSQVALTARQTWMQQQTGGLTERVEHVRRGLQANLQADIGRLHDLEELIASLRHHVELARRVPGEEAQALGDAMEYDLLKARADHAYTEAHRNELRSLLEGA